MKHMLPLGFRLEVYALSHHGYILDQSRKAKSAKALYEHLRQKHKGSQIVEAIEWESVLGTEGIPVQSQDKHRVLNLKLQEEHLSPFFKTDMNLFHMLMLDDTAEVTIFKADKGWLFVFEGIPIGPKPFGQDGFDTR